MQLSDMISQLVSNVKPDISCQLIILGTQSTESYECFIEGRTFLLFDTPGFDDTYKGDADILAEIGEVLSATYKNHLKISGIVYLHRIKDERMTNAIMRNLSMFRKLCGDDAFKNVTLATTFWDEMQDLAKGESREKQLVENRKWWEYMASKGSRVRRFMNTQESAWEIIRELAGLPKVSLQIQREMVDQGLKVNKTTAGVALNEELAELAARHTEELKKLQADMEQAIKDRDVELQETIAEIEREKKELIQHLQNEQESLRADRREEVRRLEQHFNDQLLRLERDRKEREKEFDDLESRMVQERLASESRIQEAIARSNDAVQRVRHDMENARGEDRQKYEAALHTMEARRNASVEESQRWQKELAQANDKILQLSLAQARARNEDKRELEERIWALENEKTESTTNLWDVLTPVASIAASILTGQYL
jgi:chromosome segregation ATPase